MFLEPQPDLFNDSERWAFHAHQFDNQTTFNFVGDDVMLHHRIIDWYRHSGITLYLYT